MLEFFNKKLNEMRSLLKNSHAINNLNEINFNSDTESFVSDNYIGATEDRISTITNGERNFLIQLKNPNLDVWYRVYIDANWKFPSYQDMKKNGGAFLIKKFNTNPSSIPRENLDTKVKIKPVHLSQEKCLPHIYDVPELGGEFSEKFKKNYEEYSKLMDSLMPQRIKAPFFSLCGGYPQWLQSSEIPKDFTLNDFVFQVMLEGQEERLELNNFGDGGLYVFDNGKEIALVYQR